jgi:5-methylcytosine-specific restriction protein A
MTNSSLSSLIKGLSNKYSTEISVTQKSLAQGEFELRFEDLDQTQSFSLALKRHWKTTEVRFVSDPFASRVLDYLANEANANRDQILQIALAKKSSFSECELIVDGIDIIEELRIVPNSRFGFSATLLIAESSIELGLLSEAEAKLISFAIEIFAMLLPIAKNRYTNPDEVSGFPEGAVSHVTVNKYERDPRNRKIAIQIHGKKCMVCEFDFEATYGHVGDEYIVIHHTTPVSAMGEDYKVNPATDLVSLCANCHAMVHRRNPPYSVEELRIFLFSKLKNLAGTRASESDSKSGSDTQDI